MVNDLKGREPFDLRTAHIGSPSRWDNRREYRGSLSFGWRWALDGLSLSTSWVIDPTSIVSPKLSGRTEEEGYREEKKREYKIMNLHHREDTNTILIWIDIDPSISG